jgi:methyl-accepting chemotaxis protein
MNRRLIPWWVVDILMVKIRGCKMLKSQSIGRKIGGGFGIVIVLLTVVALWSIYGIGGIVDDSGLVIDGNKLRGEFARHELDHLDWTNQVNALLTDKKIKKLDVETNPAQCDFSLWCNSDEGKLAMELVPQLKTIIEKVKEPHERLHRSAAKISGVYQDADFEIGASLREKKSAHFRWLNKVKNVFVDKTLTSLDVEMDDHNCSLGKWLYNEKTKALKENNPALAEIISEIYEPHRLLHEGAAQIQELIDVDARDLAADYFMSSVQPHAIQTITNIDQALDWIDQSVEGMQRANEIYANQTKPALTEFQGYLRKAGQMVQNNVITDEEMLTSARNTKWAVVIFSTIAGLVGLLMAFSLTRTIISNLRNIVGGLSSNAEQVSSASDQVAGSSQSLANGSAQQSSAIEETSSALEIMSGMIKRNAENSRIASELAGEASSAAERGTTAMSGMSMAMSEIKQSSDETAKIIRVIDEIAFQTNLLALNAAVEAARAGEAGKGFAVVAEEVRNLAQRSAEAAKNTNELIESSQLNADNGVRSAEELTEIFKDINASIAKVSQLISTVSSASNEQSEGVDQLNEAVSQMDQITQSNASGAEESSSASEELAAQAQQMMEYVSNLNAMIYGLDEDKTTMYHSSRDRISEKAGEEYDINIAGPRVRKDNQWPGKNRQSPVKAEEIISLENNEITDF